MRKPNFFIIGAPKCGTTSLAAWLDEHPQVFMSPIKEPHVFNTDERARFRPSPSRYARLFRDATDRHLAVGEASTRYLCSEVAVPNILAYQPEARFIVMLRNPVDMAPSLHEQALYSGEEDIVDFPTAWSLQSARSRGERVPPGCVESRHLQYGFVCSLGEQMERLYGHVARERVHVLLLDDLKANPAVQYAGVLKFLGLADDGRTYFPVLNAAKWQRSRLLGRLLRAGRRLKLALGINRPMGLARLNRLPRTRPALDGRIRAELQVFFRDDVARLARSLGRDLPEWGLDIGDRVGEEPDRKNAAIP